jgi:hypothetical protein
VIAQASGLRVRVTPIGAESVSLQVIAQQKSWFRRPAFCMRKIFSPRDRFSISFPPYLVSGDPQPRSREYGGAVQHFYVKIHKENASMKIKTNVKAGYPPGPTAPASDYPPGPGKA